VITVIVIVLALAVPGLATLNAEMRQTAAHQTLHSVTTRAYHLALANRALTAVRLFPGEWDVQEKPGAAGGRQHLAIYQYVGATSSEDASRVEFGEYFQKAAELESVRMPEDTWAAPLEALTRPVAPPPIWADARAFAARLRTELHRLVAALARKDWAAAAEALADPADWPAARLEAELAPYFAEHPRIDQTPAARKPHHTFVKELGPRRWEAVQRLVDEAGEVDWMVQCLVDLTGPFDPDRPLLTLLRVGT
jgi:hypothetical protein